MASDKGKLNINAKPFVFSAGASSFVPSQVFVPPQAAQAPAPAPAPAQAQAPAPAPVQASVAAPPDEESWEDAVDETPAPAPATAAPATAAPATAAPATAAPAATAPAKATPAPAPTTTTATQPKAAPEGTSSRKTSRKKSKNPQVETKVHDTREHLNIVFIGHVDAGKSTISGQILLLTGQVDDRTIQKYEREAKEKNRDSWYLAFIMDTNEEERAKGKTVEVGRAGFATSKKRYTILDAPGHKNYVPNMIGGAAQADVGILIISARRGEFETGFDRGGQTREHALLAKTLGVTRLIVAVNKMDESTVQWSQKRYQQIEKKLMPFLRKECGYKRESITFVPISGYTGANIKIPVTEAVCPWYTERKALLTILDELPTIQRDPSGDLRVPVVARYRDMGNITILGKVESGTLRVGDSLVMMPVHKGLEVTGIEVEDEEVEMAMPGENVCIKVKGCEEEDIHPGFVLGPAGAPPSKTRGVLAQLAVLELLEHKPLLTSGYRAVFHIHSLAIECQITKLVSTMDRKTQKKTRNPTFVKRGGVVTCKIRLPQTCSIEPFSAYPQLGRFTLRDEGKTIAIGKVLKLLQPRPAADAADSKE